MTTGLYCPREAHDALKADRKRYLLGTVDAGAMHDGLELRNCRICGGTLSDGTMLDPVTAGFGRWLRTTAGVR